MVVTYVKILIWLFREPLLVRSWYESRHTPPGSYLDRKEKYNLKKNDIAIGYDTNC